MKKFAILLVLATASCADAQYDSPPPVVPGTFERLEQLEKNQNAMLSRQARMESDLADARENLRTISDKLDAMAKIQGGSFAATKTWDGQAFSFSQQGQPVPMMAGYSSNYSSSSGMMRGRSRAKVLSRPLIGRACASGN